MSLKLFVRYASESFTLPDVCVKLRAMLNSDTTQIEDIAQLISLDPNLSAKVLRLANSALFRFPRQIETVGKAITIIGGEALYNITIAETASIAFKHFDSSVIKRTDHWRDSVFCGIVAQDLARKQRIRGSERFFVMGILQGLAHLVVAKHDPQQYRRLRLPEQKGFPWEIQRHILGFTLAQCSGAILENWRLPVPLYFPILYMHDDIKAKQDRDVCVMTIASEIVEWHFNKPSYPSRYLWDNTQKTLKFSDEDIFESIEYAESESVRMTSIMRA